MSGIVHNIISKRSFIFSGVAGLGSLETPLIRAIDISDAKAIDLVVRLHSGTIGSGASIVVKAYAISLTSDEPDTDFMVGGAVSPTALTGSVTFNGTGVVTPQLGLATLTPPFGHMIRITITATQPSTPQTITPSLSIDIVVRDN